MTLILSLIIVIARICLSKQTSEGCAIGIF